ncbi:MAG: response regulator transcription factor [Prevotella sp.]|nr:response regulator transcription factor [Prevotella sp.]
MALTCMIVDDEPLAVRLLVSYVEKTPDLQLLDSFTDSIRAINAVKEQKPDLLFLDIQMPNIDGMELAHSLPEETRVVFTTAFKEYAFESYEVNALDFLLKPIRYSKFLAAVEKAREWFTVYSLQFTGVLQTSPSDPSELSSVNSKPSTVNKTIFLKVDGEWRSVVIDKITYVSCIKDYVMFYLDDEPKALITHLTMKAVEQMLPADKFLRIHRSYIVATDKIRKIDRNDCVYIGKEIIHVPDGYLPAFRAFLESRSPS